MIAFVVPAGIEVIAVKSGVDADAKVTKTKRESMFFREDVRIDPRGSLGPRCNEYYGFQLKANREGWEVMLVHMSQVKVG
jgi:hypothetical protein